MNYQGFRDELIEVMVAEMRRGKRPLNPMAPGTYKVIRTITTGEGRGKPGLPKERSWKRFRAGKMDPDKVRDMRGRRKSYGTPYAQLGKTFGVSENVAMQICKRLKWKHVS